MPLQAATFSLVSNQALPPEPNTPSSNPSSSTGSFVKKMKEALEERSFQIVVCDESHYIKNASVRPVHPLPKTPTPKLTLKPHPFSPRCGWSIRFRI
jgi:hypothetical protein